MSPRTLRRSAIWAAAALVVTVALIPVIAEELYKKPPKDILDVLNAPAIPSAALSPAKDYVLLARSERYPPIADVSQPMLRLAGIRINPKSTSLRRLSNLIEL